MLVQKWIIKHFKIRLSLFIEKPGCTTSRKRKMKLSSSIWKPLHDLGKTPGTMRLMQPFRSGSIIGRKEIWKPQKPILKKLGHMKGTNTRTVSITRPKSLCKKCSKVSKFRCSRFVEIHWQLLEYHLFFWGASGRAFGTRLPSRKSHFGLKQSLNP